jgi:multimeric flavodoxin WrbA
MPPIIQKTVKLKRRIIRMKVLAISSGRPNGNSEILAKEALMGVQEVANAEVEVIRLLDLYIKPCRGCESCTTRGLKGLEPKCVLKGDHMPYIWEKLEGSDGLILAAPAYSITPPGILVVLRDRLTRLYRAPNPRVGALIAVGGSDWVNMCLSQMSICDPHQTKLVDQMVTPFTARPGFILLNDGAMARARKLGRNLGKALKMPIEKVKYVGEAMKVSDAEMKYQAETMKMPLKWIKYVVKEEETCPICHQHLLQVRGKYVRCAIDDVVGTIEMKRGRLTVTYDEKELEKARWKPIESKRHWRLVGTGHKTFYEKKKEIDKRLEKYKAYGNIKSPPAIK